MVYTNVIMDKLPLLQNIKTLLEDGPLSIQKIAEKTEINWRTAESFLEILEQAGTVGTTKIKNRRIYFLKDQESYFDIPVKTKDKEKIKTIYSLIKKYCNQLYKRDPTKTQVYKIIWKFNNKFKLNLPIGWYKYGPCCVLAYKSDEETMMTLPNHQGTILKQITEEYCKCDNLELQEKIYNESKNNLYITKQKLCTKEFSREQLNLLLMDLIKYAPNEATEIVTDYARTALLIGFKETSELFTFLWNYLTLLKIKESLNFYTDFLGYYLDHPIEEAKKEIQNSIKTTVECHINSGKTTDTNSSQPE
jgi:DNA-binding transcriptional regulator YhcF (GntR family)